MFCGYEVTETLAAVIDVPENYVLNVCNATCSTSTLKTEVALGLETCQLDGKVWKGVVAHLGANQPVQVKLDLVFGHKVKFYLAKGSGTVNLTGYFQPGPTSDLFKPEESISKTKKRNRAGNKATQKSWDEVSLSSSDTEKEATKKAKVAPSFNKGGPKKNEQNGQKIATKVVKKAGQNGHNEGQKKVGKDSDTTSATTLNSSVQANAQKKRKKNKHKKKGETQD